MDFIYQNYIQVQSSDPEYKRQIEDFLEQISKTPEGRAILEKALEANGGVRPTINGDVSPDGRTTTDVDKGTVTIARAELAPLRYKDTQGQWQNVSLGSAVFHELVHLTDPAVQATKGLSFKQKMNLPDPGLDKRIADSELAVAREMSGKPAMTAAEAKAYLENLSAHDGQKFSQAMNQISRYVRSTSPAERKAVDETNAFMSKYYGETFRGAYQDTDKKGTPTLETNPAIKAPGMS